MIQNYKLEINLDNSPLGAVDLGRITEVIVHSEINVPSMFSIEFVADSLNDKDWNYLSMDTIDLGSAIDISVDGKKLICGEVYSLEPKFEKGSAKVVIRGYDYLNRTRIGKKNCAFSDMKDSEILEKVIQSNQISHDVESSTGSHGNIIQFSMSDYDFLRERIGFCGFIMYMNEKSLMVQKPDLSAQPEAVLNFPQDILDGEIYLSLDADTGEHNIKSWDQNKKELIEASKAVAGTSGTMKDEKTVFQRHNDAFSETKSYMFQPEIVDAQMADSFVQNKFLLNSLKNVRGKISSNGNVKVAIGKNVELTSIGKYSGIYFVNEVKQIYRSNNLETELSIMRVGI